MNNSFIEGGRLIIQGIHEQYMGHNYTSARIDTQGKVHILYGLIAARTRINMYDGFWPALSDNAYNKNNHTHYHHNNNIYLHI